MTGGEWPPLVPGPPGQEGKLPAIVPKIPSTSKKKEGNVGSKKKVVTLEAGSLNSAYRQLEKHRFQPVPVGSESFCEETPNMKVVQDNVEMDWNLMRVAVPMTKDKVVEGINKEDKALDGPVVSSCHNYGHEQKAVNMVKKRRRKRMTLAKKKLLENRSIFCGPMKKKKTKRSRPNKSKAGQKDAQEAAVPPKVHL